MMTAPETTTIPEPEPTLAEVMTELNELRAMRQRARHLSVTPGLGGAAKTYAHAGKYVLGISQRVVKL